MTLIGRSDLDVYPLCLGANTFGWTSSRSESFAVIDEYVGAGGNFFDTADVYSAWAEGNQGGESERLIGQWLRSTGRRDDVVIATKVGQLAGAQGLSEKSLRKGVEESLRRLGTDWIDLYYAHVEDPQVPVAESAGVFADLVTEGKIRWVGLSNHSPERVSQWMAAAPAAAAPVALQPHYNLVFRQEYETALAAVAQQHDLGVMPYFSLAAGLLTGKYQQGAIAGPRSEMVNSYSSPQAERVVAAVVAIADEHNVEPAAVAIAWLLTRPAVVAPIASARIPEQLPALFEGAAIVLSDSEIAVLDEVSRGM